MSDPRYHIVGDTGLMLRFGDDIDPITHGQVLAMDRAISASKIKGLRETIPSYAALQIIFDPLITDHDELTAALKALSMDHTDRQTKKTWDVPVCYDPEVAPDLSEVAKLTGLSVEAVINAHLSGDYKTYMYGFAPGYAYMAGVPETLQIPRKTAPVRDVPAGSVIIAGPQCLVTTVKMPTGWWRIGHTDFQMLRATEDNPFPINVGDHLRFKRVSLDEVKR
ncbi:5-oxoprolinase subunit B family protein [Cochlodiniinecator piscidefendens]|uniref:5-oxoprolinase subunit B family protein n=1 Tax=Cochlodiniinecator piscidefendens TaxID=2715756 RepID=UPI00140A1D5E|nr:allophanate hydrolase subunit 1 [Cochlodiniinecator piscidefendens]